MDENETDDNGVLRTPKEGDVISGGGLPSGHKFVVDSFEDNAGIRTVTLRKLLPSGDFDPGSKKKDYFAVIDLKNAIKLEEIKYHNKMKKKFVKKGE